MIDSYRDNLIYWVWITIAFGPANPRKWEFAARFGSAKSCFEAAERGSLDGLTPDERRSVQSATLSQAEKMIAYCAENGIFVYGYDSEGYPQALRDIYDPPSVLFSYGSLDFLAGSVTLGIVGARDITEYTRTVTDSMSRELARSGVVIVSGFANGVDSVAHTAAIEVGGKTVAVLGCGLEYEYPKGSNGLKAKIRENGAVVSEYFPSSSANSVSFKARNRILTGLSKGVLITQASKTSGALNSASHALQQGRDLFCIPPADIFSPVYSGVAGLIRDGAVPVFSHRDILYEYYSDYSHKLRFTKDSDAFTEKSRGNMFFAADLPAEPRSSSGRQRSQKKDAARESKSGAEPKRTVSIDLSQLSDEQRKIVSELSKAPAAADELADKLGMDVSDLFTELTALEMDGCVRSLAGNRYELA